MTKRTHRGYLFFVYSLLYLPLLILIVLSFNNANYSMQWQGATLKWYRQLFEDDRLWQASLHSVILGVASSLIATTLGTLASISFYHYRFHGRKVLFYFLYLIIIIPDIVFGCSLLIFFHYTHIRLGFFSLLIAHVSFCIPFVMLVLNTQIKKLNPALFDAATDLGAPDHYAVKHVVLPLLKPAIISGLLLSFTLSFDDVLISYFVAGPDFEILPLHIYSLIRTGITPEINALCSLIFIISLLCVSVSQYYMKKVN